jgi:hypothetical protein
MTISDETASHIRAAVKQAMAEKLPEHYTPEVAARFAEDMIGHLNAPQTPCPDGITWCAGNPANHTDDDYHRHESTEHKLRGSYLQDSDCDGIAAFHIASWSDTGPRFVFQASGLWPDMGLDEVDELKADAVPWAVALFAARRRLAILLGPDAAAFTESEDKQTASAGFELATAAMTVALEKTDDQAATRAAMRGWLKLAEDEAHG